MSGPACWGRPTYQQRCRPSSCRRLRWGLPPARATRQALSCQCSAAFCRSTAQPGFRSTRAMLRGHTAPPAQTKGNTCILGSTAQTLDLPSASIEAPTRFAPVCWLPSSCCMRRLHMPRAATPPTCVRRSCVAYREQERAKMSRSTSAAWPRPRWRHQGAFTTGAVVWQQANRRAFDKLGRGAPGVDTHPESSGVRATRQARMLTPRRRMPEPLR